MRPFPSLYPGLDCPLGDSGVPHPSFPGLDFLTILGAHEGEGLVVEAEAEVAGSRSTFIADKGQKASNTLCDSSRKTSEVLETQSDFQSDKALSAHVGAWELKKSGNMKPYNLGQWT